METTTLSIYEPIDLLKMYFKEPYTLKENIIIKQPTIQDILDYGEKSFYSVLMTFIQTTTLCRVQLWDIGVDWNEISNYELFLSLVTTLQPNQTEILFGDLDFTKFTHQARIIPNPNFDEEKPENEKKNPKTLTKPFLYDPVNDIEINEDDYNQIALYLRTMFNTFPEDKYMKTKSFREDIIYEDKLADKLQMEKNKKKTTSMFLPLISACVNHPGFKYKIDELRELGVFAFMDSVQRLQIYESSTALLKGMYSGFIDTKGIDPSQFNFMRKL